MRIRFLIFLLFIFSCQGELQESNSKSSKIEKSVYLKIITESRKFFVGDFDNDRFNDTAFVSYKWNIKTNEIECEKNNCDISIEFRKNIPKLSFSRSKGIFVSKTEDVNNDMANEIIVFSRTNEGWWNEISVWSFKNGNWIEIAKTNAFISDNIDFENRIIKENGKYYLIGEDKWNIDEKGDYKKIKLKL